MFFKKKKPTFASRFLSLLFVPQERNNHRALLLKPSFIALLILFYLFNQSFLTFLAAVKPGVLGYTANISAEKIVSLTNFERGKLGLDSLKLSPVLNKAALLKASDMFAFNYWAHESPSGRSPWDFFRQAGYQYTAAGENLARDFADSDSVLQAWMASPTHRDNIINPKYQEIGIAVVSGTLDGIGTTLIVQMFGRPPSNVDQIASLPQKAVQTLNQPVQAASDLPPFSSAPAPPPRFNPLVISKIIATFLFFLVASTLLFDAYIVISKKIYRSAGSLVSQIAFLAVIFILIISSRQGIIF